MFFEFTLFTIRSVLGWSIIHYLLLIYPTVTYNKMPNSDYWGVGVIPTVMEKCIWNIRFNVKKHLSKRNWLQHDCYWRFTECNAGTLMHWENPMTKKGDFNKLSEWLISTSTSNFCAYSFKSVFCQNKGRVVCKRRK